jgi:hypothetical protein
LKNNLLQEHVDFSAQRTGRNYVIWFVPVRGFWVDTLFRPVFEVLWDDFYLARENFDSAEPDGVAGICRRAGVAAVFLWSASEPGPSG